MKKFLYPKITVLIFCIVLSYVLFSSEKLTFWLDNLNQFNYVSSFIAGLLFSYGFSAPFAVGFFLKLNVSNPLPLALVAGFGALLSDLLIFKLIKFSMMDEFNRIKKTKPLKLVNFLLKKRFGSRALSYLSAIFAGIIIASPLPDELGVSMLSGLTTIKLHKFAVISYICNTFGILVMLYL